MSGTRADNFDRHLERGRRALAEGRTLDLIAEVSAAETLLDAKGGDPVRHLQVASLLQAAFRFSGESELRDRGVSLCQRLADRVDDPSTAIRARATLATFHVISGRFFAMHEACAAAIDLARATDRGHEPAAAMAHQFRGYALFEWNRIDEAKEALERAWSLSKPEWQGIRSGTARMLLSVHHALGDSTRAEAWLSELEEIVSEPMTLRNREWLAAVRTMARGRHDLREIDSWVRTYDYSTGGDLPAEPDEAASRLHELSHLLTVLEATSQWASMIHVAEVMAVGARSSRHWFRVRSLTARAVALEAMGRPGKAEVAWAEALTLGESEGYARIYLDGAWPRAALMERSVHDGRVGAMAKRILATRPQSPDSSPRLTPRQLETLRHLATGLRNSEIAAAMSVSETTVKTHLRAIYERLGVRSRTEAIVAARAHELA